MKPRHLALQPGQAAARISADVRVVPTILPLRARSSLSRAQARAVGRSVGVEPVTSRRTLLYVSGSDDLSEVIISRAREEDLLLIEPLVKVYCYP